MAEFLKLVQAVITLLCILSVTALVSVGTILVIDLYRDWKADKAAEKARKPISKTRASIEEQLRKEAVRREKERAAHEGFFEESYARRFDASGALTHHTVVIPTKKALDYYKQMDQIAADNRIFDNTEEL